MIIKKKIQDMCLRAKRSSRELALIDGGVKDRALLAMSRSITAGADKIIRANLKDIDNARSRNMPGALIDRLRLTPERILSMTSSLKNIAALADPAGEIIETIKRPNGLLIKKVRVPIGLIMIVYESRPNVTCDCAALCIKSSNGVILRGGSEAINSNIAIFDILKSTAIRQGLPTDAISMIKDTDRRVMDEFLIKDGIIDLVIPRGGESLIRYVTDKSRVPVIKHYKGVCHTYVDKSADLDMALSVCMNAKVQRSGVCNAMETLLVDRRIAVKFLPEMVAAFRQAGVEVRGCAITRRLCDGVKAAVEKDWYTEYLDMIISVRVVDGVSEAVSHIMKYGSYHSDAIVAKDRAVIEKFLNEVDSACVYANASTRFTDGGEFGMGAEMGISTDKIHARGPMGLRELTSYKYIVYGNGQIRK